MTAATPSPERECGWCRIAYSIWKAVRCIETDDDLVFCSLTCLERYEEATGEWREINEAIIERWSISALVYIKEKAWKLTGLPRSALAAVIWRASIGPKCSRSRCAVTLTARSIPTAVSAGASLAWRPRVSAPSFRW